jgi:hypothetical protein
MLTMKDPRMTSRKSGSYCTLPLFMVHLDCSFSTIDTPSLQIIHDRKWMWDHELVFRRMVDLIPQVRGKHCHLQEYCFKPFV